MHASRVVSVLVLALLSGCAAHPRGVAPLPTVGVSGHDCHNDASSPAGAVAKARAVFSGRTERAEVSIPSFDGHRVPATLYRPLEADAAHPVPILLHSHGWSNHRVDEDGAFLPYSRAGFGVVSFDMRGHGDARATSEAHVDSMDYEIRDVAAVIDYVAALPWVMRDGPQDPRMGAMGLSYGGGYQLLIAAIDPRVDAIAPDITWNSLPDALAPHGVINSVWVDFLYAAGNAFARVAPEIHEGLAIAQAENRLPDGSVPGEPDLVAQLSRSSPSHYPDAIRVPTFLTQGANDTLFPLTQALRNYQQIRAQCADVSLVSHLGGHILNVADLTPAPANLGLQTRAGSSPCGDLDAYRAAFFQTELWGLVAHRGPRVCFALDDRTNITGASYPLPDTQMRAFSQAAPIMLPQGAPATITVPLWTADQDTILLGGPRLRANASSVLPQAVLFASLLVHPASGPDRVLNEQVTPDRVAGDGPIDFELNAVSARLHRGDEVRLQLASQDDRFVHNGGRVAGLLVLSDLEVEVPVIPA